MKINKIIILLILINMITVANIEIATAETGIVTVTADVFKTYFYDGGTVGTNTTLGNFSYFKFDISDYNTISNFSILLNGISAPYQSNVTEFDCLSPNVCHGITSYSEALNKINWVFSENSYIIQSPIILEYGQPIFNGFTKLSIIRTLDGAPDINHPICMVVMGDKCLYLIDGYALNTYNIITGTSAHVAYNITYPIPGWYQFFVDKSGDTVLSKVNFTSNTNNISTHIYETTFNLTNFAGSAEYTDGLYINLSLVGGQYSKVLINSSGILGVLGEGYNLQFNKTLYNLGDSVRVYYNITNPDITANYYLKIYQDFSQWNRYVGVYNGGITIDEIDKTQISLLQVKIFKNDIEAYSSVLMPYGFINNLSVIQANFSLDKYNYVVGDIMNISYNSTITGRFLDTCTGGYLNFNAGEYMNEYMYQTNFYVIPCFIKMQTQYNGSWMDIETHEFRITNFTNNTYFNKQYYSLGEQAIIYYSSNDNMNTISLKDSNNKVIFNYSTVNTQGLTLNHKYNFTGTDATGTYTIFLNDTLHNILSSQIVKVMDAIIVTPVDTSITQPYNFLDMASDFSEVFIGKIAADESQGITDDDIKKKGNKIYIVILFMVLIIFAVGTWNKIKGK